MEKGQEYHQVTLDEWQYWKEDIRSKLRETAGNFVYIGCRLRQIRDSGIYGGAGDIFEFALKEYGLRKSTVSRFIAINEKFSEGGSLELKAEYRDIGSSKLSEMLTLPDAECSLITERTTVKEIRDLKDFLRQQAHEEGPGTLEELDPLQKCLKEYFRDKKELLNAVMGLIHKNKAKEAAELLNPSGYGTFRRGMVYIFMYGYSEGVKYKVFGRQEVSKLTWEEFFDQAYDIYGRLYEAGEEDVHGAYYGESPVATSQQGREESLLRTGEGGSEEPLPGKMKVEDYPELCQEEKGKGCGLEADSGSGICSRENEDKEERTDVEDIGGKDAADMENENGKGRPEKGKKRERGRNDAAELGGGPASGEIQGLDAGGGTSPSAGREADYWERIKVQSLGEIWEEIAAALKGVERFVWDWNSMDQSSFPRESLEEAHVNAVDLAAALEKLMIVRDVNGKVDNA